MRRATNYSEIVMASSFRHPISRSQATATFMNGACTTPAAQMVLACALMGSLVFAVTSKSAIMMTFLTGARMLHYSLQSNDSIISNKQTNKLSEDAYSNLSSRFSFDTGLGVEKWASALMVHVCVLMDGPDLVAAYPICQAKVLRMCGCGVSRRLQICCLFFQSLSSLSNISPWNNVRLTCLQEKYEISLIILY